MSPPGAKRPPGLGAAAQSTSRSVPDDRTRIEAMLAMVRATTYTTDRVAQDLSLVLHDVEVMGELDEYSARKLRRAVVMARRASEQLRQAAP